MSPEWPRVQAHGLVHWNRHSYLGLTFDERTLCDLPVTTRDRETIKAITCLLCACARFR